MSDTQDRFLAAIRQDVETLGLDYRRDAEWANTGNVRVFRSATDFGEALLSFHYAFQTGSASFSGTFFEEITVLGQLRRPWHHAEYDRGDLTIIRDQINAALHASIAARQADEPDSTEQFSADDDRARSRTEPA